MDVDGIGRRVAHWRQQRRRPDGTPWTQYDLATRLNKSHSWVQKLESGDRQADPRLSVLEDISRTLAVPLETLLGLGGAITQPCADDNDVAGLRAALMRADVLAGNVQPTKDSPADDALRSMQKEATYALEAYHSGRFSALLRLLPDIVVRSHASATLVGSSEALAALSDVYHVSAVVLMRFSSTDLAWHCANKALTLAHGSGDPARIGLATQACSYALWGQGQSQAGVDLAVSTSADLRVTLEGQGAAGLSVLGIVQLKGAVSAAELGDDETALQLLMTARLAAERINDHQNLWWTQFGLTNVQLHEASILTQLGRPSESIAAARSLDQKTLARLPRERRAYHLSDTARAYQLTGRDDESLEVLLTADRDVPDQVRCLPGTRDLITDLLGMRQAPTLRLRSLARRCGVDQ